jgi:hypothetical protein
MKVIGDVKCYHCGHVTGQIEGERGDRLVLERFNPRAGYQGTPPGRGDRIRCDRCGGPVYIEDLHPLPMYQLTPLVPKKPRAPRRAA